MGDSSEKRHPSGRLSIGQLSRLTGVHIKSLRYYGRLGILRPAYTDPASGYRYYAISQIRLVEAIALCVDIGLPLKRFAAYLRETGSISYGAIIRDGLALIEARQQALRAHTRLLNQLLTDARHGQRCADATSGQRLRLPARVCRVEPCGPEGPDAAFDRLIAGIARDGLSLGYESGALLLLHEGKQLPFVFADLRGPLPPANAPAARGLLRFPAADWLCTVPKGATLLEDHVRLPKAFRVPTGRIVIERDLFTPNYAFEPPRMEWLCSPPDTLPRLRQRLLALAYTP